MIAVQMSHFLTALNGENPNGWSLVMPHGADPAIFSRRAMSSSSWPAGRFPDSDSTTGEVPMRCQYSPTVKSKVLAQGLLQFVPKPTFFIVAGGFASRTCSASVSRTEITLHFRMYQSSVYRRAAQMVLRRLAVAE